MKNLRSVICLTMAALLAAGPLAAQTKFYGFKTSKSDNYNWGKDYHIVESVVPYLGASGSGLRRGDIIKTVNGRDASQLETVREGLNYESDRLEVLRLGAKDPVAITLAQSYVIPESALSEGDVISRTMIHTADVSKDNNPPYCKAIADPDVDFHKYRTFDFEYVNQDNLLQEKRQAIVVEKVLTKMGLKRDRENPDFLVVMDFFSGNESQYIPPTQRISTRYNTEYNFWTKRYETKQYVESSEQGNYTKNTQTNIFKLAFYDAAKLKKQTNAAMAFWMGEFIETTSSSSPVDDEKFIRRATDRMVGNNYPYVSNEPKYYNYAVYVTLRDLGIPIMRLSAFQSTTLFAAGIWYASQYALNVVAFVAPGSPAEKAGLQAGDIITAIGTKKMPTRAFDAVYTTEILTAKEKAPQPSAFKYLYNETPWEDPGDYKADAQAADTFFITRNKKKMEIKITRGLVHYADFLPTKDLIYTYNDRPGASRN